MTIEKSKIKFGSESRMSAEYVCTIQTATHRIVNLWCVIKCRLCPFRGRDRNKLSSYIQWSSSFPAAPRPRPPASAHPPASAPSPTTACVVDEGRFYLCKSRRWLQRPHQVPGTIAQLVRNFAVCSADITRRLAKIALSSVCVIKSLKLGFKRSSDCGLTNCITGHWHWFHYDAILHATHTRMHIEIWDCIRWK